MTISKTAGLVAAPFTPFRANGELDLDRIDDYPEFLARG
jgi:dihydrodipicolinate synthase/N-acetylneuraminate lyase